MLEGRFSRRKPKFVCKLEEKVERETERGEKIDGQIGKDRQMAKVRKETTDKWEREDQIDGETDRQRKGHIKR